VAIFTLKFKSTCRRKLTERETRTLERTRKNCTAMSKGERMLRPLLAESGDPGSINEAENV